METWNYSEVRSFLIWHGFGSELADDLERKEIDGRTLQLIANDESFKDVHEILGLKAGKLILLRYDNFKALWKSLNVINLGHDVFDHINQKITLTNVFDLIIIDKLDL